MLFNSAVKYHKTLPDKDCLLSLRAALLPGLLAEMHSFCFGFAWFSILFLLTMLKTAVGLHKAVTDH